MKQFIIGGIIGVIFGIAILSLLFPKPDPNVITGEAVTGAPDSVLITQVIMDTSKIDSLKKIASDAIRHLELVKRLYRRPITPTPPKPSFVMPDTVWQHDTVTAIQDKKYNQYKSFKTQLFPYNRIKAISWGLAPADSIRIEQHPDFKRWYADKYLTYMGLTKGERYGVGVGLGVGVVVKSLVK